MRPKSNYKQNRKHHIMEQYRNVHWYGYNQIDVLGYVRMHYRLSGPAFNYYNLRNEYLVKGSYHRLYGKSSYDKQYEFKEFCVNGKYFNKYKGV